jgi:hypothetical protein
MPFVVILLVTIGKTPSFRWKADTRDLFLPEMQVDLFISQHVGFQPPLVAFAA